MNEPRLMVEMEKVAKRISRNVFKAFHQSDALSLDDLEQEGMLAAFEEIEGFDEEHGVSVATYLWQRVRTKVRRYAQKQIRSSGMLDLDFYPPSALAAANGWADRHNKAQRVYDARQFRGHKSLETYDPTESILDVETIMENVNPVDGALLIDRFLHGGTLAELAHKYGISPATVRRRVNAATSKLRGLYNVDRR
jgi:RNA polymerase sigma factor (sigma-70 family)